MQPRAAAPAAAGPLVDFDEAYRRLRPAMVRLAHLLTGSVDAAEDVVHDAFLACSRHWSKLESPDAYVRRAVVNQARTCLRQVGRDRDKADRFGRAAPVTVGMPELDDLWDALRCLPDRQRMALVLRFYQDLPVAEIALSDDPPQGSVATRPLVPGDPASLRYALITLPRGPDHEARLRLSDSDDVELRTEIVDLDKEFPPQG